MLEKFFEGFYSLNTKTTPQVFHFFFYYKPLNFMQIKMLTMSVEIRVFFSGVEKKFGWLMQGLVLGQPSIWCGGTLVLGTCLLRMTVHERRNIFLTRCWWDHIKHHKRWNFSLKFNMLRSNSIKVQLSTESQTTSAGEISAQFLKNVLTNVIPTAVPSWN